MNIPIHNPFLKEKKEKKERSVKKRIKIVYIYACACIYNL